jgi:hypothetical protein
MMTTTGLMDHGPTARIHQLTLRMDQRLVRRGRRTAMRSSAPRTVIATAVQAVSEVPAPVAGSVPAVRGSTITTADVPRTRSSCVATITHAYLARSPTPDTTSGDEWACARTVAPALEVHVAVNVTASATASDAARTPPTVNVRVMVPGPRVWPVIAIASCGGALVVAVVVVVVVVEVVVASWSAAACTRSIGRTR